jgi:hypothetical protein
MRVGTMNIAKLLELARRTESEAILMSASGT